MRPPIFRLDADSLANGLRELVQFAQGKADALSVPAREVAEALQTVHLATTARTELARGRAIRAGELAALVGVHPTRIRQLVRAGVLKREGLGLTAESCLAWLGSAPRSPIKAHVLRVDPDWWPRRWPSRRFEVAGRLSAALHEWAPAGSVLDFLFDDRVVLRIPREAGLDVVAAEQVQAAVRGWLSANDPGDGRFPADPPAMAEVP